ncbi:hypothetical protein AEQ18_06465 [Enterococcus sp. RIT-PI-f]|nr:hypothetical protein AEQ18_06465 [Enterococcus sp. RIT-PI-f]
MFNWLTLKFKKGVEVMTKTNRLLAVVKFFLKMMFKVSMGLLKVAVFIFIFTFTFAAINATSTPFSNR